MQKEYDLRPLALRLATVPWLKFRTTYTMIPSSHPTGISEPERPANRTNDMFLIQLCLLWPVISPAYHHTIADYFSALIGAGLHVTNLLEPPLSKKLLKHHPAFADYQDHPISMVFCARKA